MPGIEFFLGIILVLLLYPIFTKWHKSYQDFTKPTRLPNPPTREGPSPFAAMRTCLSGVVRLVLIILVVVWLVWLLTGL